MLGAAEVALVEGHDRCASTCDGDFKDEAVVYDTATDFQPWSSLGSWLAAIRTHAEHEGADLLQFPVALHGRGQHGNRGLEVDGFGGVAAPGA